MPTIQYPQNYCISYYSLLQTLSWPVSCVFPLKHLDQTQLMCHVPFVQDVRGWAPNDRGVSWTFGGDVLRAFLEHHNLSLVVRAHQVCTTSNRSLFTSVKSFL